jgi:eukaryotic-like serine/threonine-protein kinase
VDADTIASGLSVLTAALRIYPEMPKPPHMKTSANGAALHLRAMVLFDEYLDLKGFRRTLWLARLRRDELPELTAAVNALVAADRDTDGRLEHGVPDFTLSTVRAGEMTGMLGRRLGQWRIDSPIGHGGSGAIYLAHRVDACPEHLCALKVVPIEPEGVRTQERIREGQEQLAHLSHPNIATLLDGGMEDGTLPWFAMELVRGEPIDVYSARKKLTVRSRIRLMMDVADALCYAHNRLVVHRDIKPSNLMVTAKGNVKLLDFGISALLAERVMPEHRPANHGATPRFAAPEQFKGESVTTGIDIYAFGLLLHLLLCGRHAFGRATLAISYMDHMAPRYVPGQMLRAARAMRREEAATWSSSPHTLARSLKGDLDAVVARCLQADPVDRYATAAALKDDLAAWLDMHSVRGWLGWGTLRRH